MALSMIMFQRFCKKLSGKFGHGKSFGFSNNHPLDRKGDTMTGMHTGLKRAELEAGGDAVRDLAQTIERFIADYNKAASPSAWVATADSILKKLERFSMRICGTEHLVCGEPTNPRNQ